MRCRPFAVPVLVASALLAGCDRGPATRMRGTYTHGDGHQTLVVTSDQMAYADPPLADTAHYQVLHVDGNRVTAEVNWGNAAMGFEVVIVVGDGSIDVPNGPFPDCHWVRR